MSKASVSGGKDGLYDAIIEMKDGTPFSSPVHCADLTEDLSGNVGILEIAGALDKGFNIQPGHGGNAVYNAARDGSMKQVQPFPATKPTGEVFYNWGLFPGWQKWHRPTYRYGTITHVYTGADTCDVTLDPCYATDTPDWEQLSINPDDLTLGDVPIEYMDCDSAAFSDDDRVIVKFEGPLVVADPWGNPKVIGFESEPKGCYWESWGGPLYTSNHIWTPSFYGANWTYSLDIENGELVAFGSAPIGMNLVLRWDATAEDPELDIGTIAWKFSSYTGISPFFSIGDTNGEWVYLYLDSPSGICTESNEYCIPSGVGDRATFDLTSTGLSGKISVMRIWLAATGGNPSTYNLDYIDFFTL